MDNYEENILTDIWKDEDGHNVTPVSRNLDMRNFIVTYNLDSTEKSVTAKF